MANLPDNTISSSSLKHWYIRLIYLLFCFHCSFSKGYRTNKIIFFAEAFTRRRYIRKGLLENFAKFTGEELCLSHWPLASHFVKEGIPTMVFSCEFSEIFKETFFNRTRPDDVFSLQYKIYKASSTTQQINFPKDFASKY